MIVLAGVILGGLWGFRTAAKAGGNGKDKAQYAIGYGIAFGLLGLIVTLLLDRLVF